MPGQHPLPTFRGQERLSCAGTGGFAPARAGSDEFEQPGGELGHAQERGGRHQGGETRPPGENGDTGLTPHLPAAPS